MEWTDFVSFISLPLAAVVAYIWRQTQLARSDLAAYKTEVAKEYASKALLKDMEDRIMKRLDKIEDKVDRYANGVRQQRGN